MRDALEVLALSFLLALSLTFMVVFNTAVLGGGKTTVKVNKYGEMIPELLILHFIVAGYLCGVISLD